jgi:hypothetical protein
VYVPSPSAANVPDHDPSPATGTVNVCAGAPEAVLPANTDTRTELASTAALPVPATRGVAVFTDDPPTGAVTTTTGPLMSTVNVTAALEPVLPAPSV